MLHPANYGDTRQVAFCLYCGRGTETREHVPSRVLLDEPYPENLPVVGACEECNRGYSLDEEYVACLIECARVGSANPDLVEREKVRRILYRQPRLLKKIQKSVEKVDNSFSFTIDVERFQRVLLKLARGHFLFEQNEPTQESPSEFNFGLLQDLDDVSRTSFENIPLSKILPEVGSRAMQRMLIIEDRSGSPWIEIQSNRYRYLSSQTGVVRLVLSEYIWCEIIWD